ncbi:MAG: hypothetical protein JJLCMIEE_03519 [Acidimicrobiales bacterium]|nr:hypothetical protein [Acidimicrobiales bacterium]
MVEGAVREAALAGQSGDLGKRPAPPLLAQPQSHGPQTWGVDEHTAAGHQEQLPGGGRVPALRVAGAQGNPGPIDALGGELWSAHWPTR